MANNTITIEFTPCEPTPANGYIVSYRPLGSDEELRIWPDPFTESPAVFTDTNDDPGTEYEGFIQADCGDGNLSVEVPWQTAEESASGSASASIPAIDCGMFSVQNNTDGDIEVAVIYCDGSGLSTDNMAPSAVLILCRAQSSPGVPVVAFPPALTVEYLGGCESNAVSVGLGATEEDACSDSSVVYVEPPSFDVATGVQVWADGAMTIPASGAIIRNSGGTLYNMSGGLVGAPTGTSC